MKLLLVGLSHLTAPVEVRERYAVAPADLAGVNEKLVREVELDEVVLLSTCNRTEILAVSRTPEAAAERLRRALGRELGDGSVQPAHLYELHESDVVSHVLRVASSLDSMVLGEAQILGQMKAAYRAGVVGGSIGPLLGRLLQRAFRAAKRVRTETGLGASPISVARIGVQLARQLFESFETKTVLLIGAGEMAESALRGLREAGVARWVVASRTLESATRLAQRFGGRALALSELEEGLADADIVICSVQLDRPILAAEQVALAMRGRRGGPLLIVDLGVPRNVAPAVRGVENVYLYDLDDLESVASASREQRRSALVPAMEILLHERKRFEAWRASLPLAPTVRTLLERSRKLAREEAARLSLRLGADPPVPLQELERMADAIVAKLLHTPLEALRRESENGGALYYAEAVRRLFGLDVEEDDG